jgi:hypothetical protein
VTVYVLGCGPAGLAAAHAAVQLGEDVRIFSKRRKSQMFGAQYLHKPIPGIETEEPVEIKYRLEGSIQQYRRKVYGAAYDGTVSPGTLEESHLAWDIRETYDKLWALYSDRITNVSDIDEIWMARNRHLRPMISSIPRTRICIRPIVHTFHSVDIYAAGEAPEWGIYFSGFDHIRENTVLCNGRDTPAWYRASRIFDRVTVEWPGDSIPGEQSGFRVVKPITNSCNCWPEILCVGRYGSWTKGVLVHHAYEEANEWLNTGESQS